MRVLDAPGCSVRCCNRNLSSQERRFNSRSSQSALAFADTEFFERNALEEHNFEGGLPFSLSMKSDSPNITKRRLLLISMKSRITLRVRRCQNNSLSSTVGKLALKTSAVASSLAFSTSEPLMVCSARAVLGLDLAR